MIEVIKLSNRLTPSIKPTRTTKYIGNNNEGEGINEYFEKIKKAYVGSPTNASIIDAYVNYIFGEGITEKNNLNLRKWISNSDLRLICNDLYLYGSFCLQVVWSVPEPLLKIEAKPIKIKHMPVNKIALRQNDETNEIDGVWYSYDWSNQSRYKPEFYSMFDGKYDPENLIQMLFVNRPTSEQYFAQPMWNTGLQSCFVEEELINYSLNYIVNGFSGGKIINVNSGKIESEEDKRLYSNDIKTKLTGTDNQNKIIISFNDGVEGGELTINNIEPNQGDTMYQELRESAKEWIFSSHSVVSPILFGVRDGGGLGSNKDEMTDALKQTYRRTINPLRDVIIEALEKVIEVSEPNVFISFKDFDELDEEKITTEDEINN